MARPANPRTRLYVPKPQGDMFTDEQNEWLMRQFRTIANTFSTVSDILAAIRQTWRDFSDNDGARLDNAGGDTGWYVFPVTGGGATQPDMLEVTTPQGVGGDFSVEARVRVENTSSRTGTAYLGIGYDGAVPDAGNIVSFPIPATFVGNLDLFLILPDIPPTPSEHTVTVWTRVVGDHSQFRLFTTTVNGNHFLQVTLMTL